MLRDHPLVAVDHLRPVFGTELGIEREPAALLVLVEHILEQMMFDTQHHVGIHLDEAPIAVEGEPAIARTPGDALDGLVVEAEIQHGVHHAGHRGAGA